MLTCSEDKRAAHFESLFILRASLKMWQGHPPYRSSPLWVYIVAILRPEKTFEENLFWKRRIEMEHTCLTMTLP